MNNLPDTLTEKQRTRTEAYFECECSDTKTAKHLGITVTSLRKSLWQALKKGVSFTPDNYSPVAPVGWDCAKSTVSYVDDNGNRRWDRIKPVTVPIEDISKYFAERIPACNIDFPEIKEANDKIMIEWPVYDVHHGMLAWGDETGNDYDHKIARHLQISAGRILLSSFGKVERINIILGGDNQTADNRDGKTERSGNILDTDSRYAKMAWSCFESAVSSIEIACQFAREVFVVVLSGNHDYHSAIHHTIALDAYYRNVDKVTIDTSPARHRFYSWGRRVVMATHGDVNEKRIAPYALKKAIEHGYGKDPKMNLNVLMGHLHTRSRKTPDMLGYDGGVRIERFPTIAAQEAYSVEGAYLSTRATMATTWHKDRDGYQGSREVTVGDILDRFPIEGE